MTPDQIVQLILSIIGFASLVLQFIPELDKNSKFKPFLKILGNYVAFNKPTVRNAIVSILSFLSKRK